MLMATLREGAPAPAPSKVMIAAAKPFIPKLDDAKTPLPSERSFALSSASSRAAELGSAAARRRRPNASEDEIAGAVCLRVARTEPQSSRRRRARAAPVGCFAPTRNERQRSD